MDLVSDLHVLYISWLTKGKCIILSSFLFHHQTILFQMTTIPSLQPADSQQHITVIPFTLSYGPWKRWLTGPNMSSASVSTERRVLTIQWYSVSRYSGTQWHDTVVLSVTMQWYSVSRCSGTQCHDAVVLSDTIQWYLASRYSGTQCHDTVVLSLLQSLHSEPASWALAAPQYEVTEVSWSNSNSLEHAGTDSPTSLSEQVNSLVSWRFEPSQPQRVISGLKTNFSLSPSSSFHK